MSSSEKEIFTKNRKTLDANRIHNISVNEIEQWGQYCLVPLAIPCVDFTGIADWFFANHQEIPEASRKLLRHNRIDINLSTTVPTKPWEKQREQAFLNEFPTFVEQLYDVFPFKKISTFRFWQSFAPIEMHRENDDFRDFPNGFRSVVYDENPNPTLYVEEMLPDSSEIIERKYVCKLEDTNSWAWNNLRVKHGSDYDPNYKKLLMLVDRFELDGAKYNKIMEASISKYQDYILKSKKQLSDYVLIPNSMT
jgi:hypothetical protein